MPSPTDSHSAISHPSNHGPQSPRAFAALCLAALGVVFGDIGTSPLYAMSEIFFGHGGVSVTPEHARGAASLVFWTLTLVISLKYVIVVLSADHHGEGGVFALLGSLRPTSGARLGGFGLLLILAAGLLYGDGLITPAISVLSAVEGLRLAFDGLDAAILPITVAILVGLFAIQHRGTQKIGRIFGPVIVLWLATLAALGVVEIARYQQILAALNPAAALAFVGDLDIHAILAVLGSVLLCVTGGEALYADMGHFGRRPIRVSWFAFVYPALVLNYFGQAAFLAAGNPVREDNLFYSLVPQALLIPAILLATAATVIASQALITGAFSLTKQAIALGLFPRVRIVHTSEAHEGQIYMPSINWALMIGCIALVLAFKSGTALAAAYGFAVAAVMTVTTIGVALVARRRWNWSRLRVTLVLVPLALFDLAFFTASATKFDDGGYVPLLIGMALLALMSTWHWGRSLIARGLGRIVEDDATVATLIESKKHGVTLPRSVVVMTSRSINSLDDHIPAPLQSFWDRFGALPKHIIFLTVVQEAVPRVARAEQLEVIEFSRSEKTGSVATVRVHCGYLESPELERALKRAKRDYHIKIPGEPAKWLVVVGQERLIGRPPGLFGTLRLKFFRTVLRNSVPAYEYLGFGNHAGVTVETITLRCHERGELVTAG